MKILIPFGMLVALAGCGSDSVVSNAAAPPDNVVGDVGGKGLADPANAGAREQALKAAVPAPTDGLGWHWDAAATSASFGPSPAIHAFAIACTAGRIVARRFDGAPHGAQATMSFTGNGKAASLPAAAVGDTARMESWWEASVVPSDTTQAVARVFDGPAPVEISLPGTTTLVTRPSPLPGRAIAACRS